MKFGDKCDFSHSLVSAEVKKCLKLPSRSPSPAAGNKKEKDGTGGGAGIAVPTRFFCKFFLKWECKRGEDCIFAHLQQEAVNAINHAKAKAKAVGKAKPKAKVTASGPFTVPAPIGGPGPGAALSGSD